MQFLSTLRHKITMTPKFLRAAEAARYLGLAPQTLARWRCEALDGRLIPFSRIGRAVVYDVTDLDTFMRERRITSTSGAPVAESLSA